MSSRFRLSALALSFALLGAAPLLPAAEHAAAQPAAVGKATLPLDELRTFAEVLDRIKTAYVEPVDDKTLLENAIKGMLSNLDPHSAYLDPQEFQELQESTSGEFGGLGIELGLADGQLKVVSPIDDTPAARAGIEAGDLIVRIDGQPTKGWTLVQAVDKLRGKAGSKVELTLLRGAGKPFTVKLERAVIKVRSVKSELLEKNYGYLRITQFQVNSGEEVGKALARLKKDNGGKLAGLILDLRNNPGGVLQSAVQVADHFLTKGLIVYTKGRIPNSELRFSADPADASEGVPLVVLINGGSASAAEIVAGALQDQKRAVLMGTDSFGKGSVQTVLPLTNDRALKLTTALYYTPSGRSIQAQGIVPDIVVERGTVTHDGGQGFSVKEADLPGHLGNGNGGADKPSKAGKSDAGAASATKGDAKPASGKAKDDDYQLNQALNLLKGLNVTRKP